MAKKKFNLVRSYDANDSTASVTLGSGEEVHLGETFEIDDTSHIYHNLATQFLLEPVDESPSEKESTKPKTSMEATPPEQKGEVVTEFGILGDNVR